MNARTGTNGLIGAEAFLHVLADMGIDRIFASPGSEWAPVWEYLAKPDLGSRLRYLSSRHEETAVAMASGYAKASGKLPAVMLHTTVGSLHASMALRGALHENVPMVVFAGETIAFGEDPVLDPGPWWLPQLADIGGPARLVERCVKWSFALNTKAALPATIQRACQIAMAPPMGPAFVSVPMEFLLEKMASANSMSAAIPLPPSADPSGIKQLVDMLLAAKNPVIVTEEGGKNVAAVERLIALAELIGAPVVETRISGYVNFPRRHPLHAGFNPAEILTDADLVLLLGVVAPWHPATATFKAGAKVAVLSENPLRAELPFWGYQVDLCLMGDVQRSLEVLLQLLKEHIQHSDHSRAKGTERWRLRNEERRRSWQEEAKACKEKKPMDTRWVVHELNNALPPDAMVVEETITHRIAVGRYLDSLKPGSFFAGAYGGLGTGLGVALGVKEAAPERPVIAVIGDGSFNYNPVLAALGYAQQYGMPILIVLMNNHGYLSQKIGIPQYFPHGWAVKMNTYVGTSITPRPDYAGLARLFGGYGEKVEEPGEVRPSLLRGLKAIASGKLALIDMWLEPVN